MALRSFLSCWKGYVSIIFLTNHSQSSLRKGNPRPSAVRTRTGTDRGIDVGLWTLYEMEEYKEDGIKRYTGSGFAGGIELAINFDINENWFLQPYFVLGYFFDTIKEESTSETENYRGGCSSIGAALGYKLDNGNSIVFCFEQDSDSIEWVNDTAYEITVGYNHAL